MRSHLAHLLGLHITHATGVVTLMLLVKAYLIDPMVVFVRTLSVNIYLTIFLYINFVMKNLGISINNTFKKRRPVIIIKETFIATIAIGIPIMLYFLYA